jgi:DNA-binding XRE family transcriptional regulator
VQYNGAAIRAIRRKSGRTQAGLAADIATSQGHIANIEAGRDQPSDDLANSIAAALELDDLRAIVGEIPADPLPVIKGDVE